VKPFGVNPTGWMLELWRKMGDAVRKAA
jgi:hypothetical protein